MQIISALLSCLALRRLVPLVVVPVIILFSHSHNSGGFKGST